MMNLSHYILTQLRAKCIDVAFLVTGGMAMHLNNALAQSNGLKTVCCHHEQACSLAAEAYAHVTGKPALVQVTAGPGIINAMSGIFGAYVDGLPMIVVCGQSKRETTCAAYGLKNSLRQAGEQEVDAVAMAKPITKYAARVHDATRIRYELEKAYHIATSGRPGPVLLEIPVDVQGQEVDPGSLASFHVPTIPPPDLSGIASDILEQIQHAKRPMLVVGPGVRAAHAVEEFRELAAVLQCPVQCAGVLDVIFKDEGLYAGGMGNVGTRAGNINVQNADLLIFIGVTMHLTFTTYNWNAMGKNARKIVVEGDVTECERPQYIADETIACDAKEFVQALLHASKHGCKYSSPEWLAFCRERVDALPAVPEHLRRLDAQGRINAYWFAEELFKRLGDGDVVVPGNASAGVTAQQAGALRPGQRLIANFGNGPMGMALPAAVGASMAAPESRIVCLDGDGSFMMNMQELATISHNAMPIIVFVYNNDGYMSIRLMQNTFFSQKIGCDPESGTSFPDFVQLAEAFGVKAMRLQGEGWQTDLDSIMLERGPLLVEVMLDPAQGFEPKMSSKRLADGRMVTMPPENMFPFLSEEELSKHIITH